MKIKSILILLLAMCMLIQAAPAEEAAPVEAEPASIVTIGVKEAEEGIDPRNRILCAYALYVDSGEGMQKHSTVMRYAHYWTIYADGIIFKSDLSYALEPLFGPIDEVLWSGPLAIELDVEKDVTAACTWKLWRYNGTGFEAVTEPQPVAETLGNGRYLLVIEMSVNGMDDKWGEQYYCGTGFLWLNVITETDEN